MILLIDNYDSFVHNLGRYLELLGQHVVVVRNDCVTIDWIVETQPAAIVVSPGPCTPTEAGQTLAIVSRFMDSLPILGVCLGHQAIVQALGGTIIHANEPMHGRVSDIRHDGRFEFVGLPNPLTVARYHSLMASSAGLPAELEISATSDDGTIMAVRHRHRPVVGWQFHPESILTPQGIELLKGFLHISDLPATAATVEWRFDDELLSVGPPTAYESPARPVTF